MVLDMERGTPTYAENADLSDMTINLVSQEEPSVSRSADMWSFVFQVIFQASSLLTFLPTRRQSLLLCFFFIICLTCSTEYHQIKVSGPG